MGKNDRRHPDDIANEKEGVEYAAAHAKEFFEEHRAEFEKLMSTYGDNDALDQLWDLREQFWARRWVPAASRKDDQP